MLGVGGLRALKALGISPGVLHLNEGHSAFAVLEAIRLRMEEEGIGFDAAVPRVSREVVFTTHTPVPAGHDRFDAKLVEEHIGPLREALGLSPESLLGLGRENTNNSDELFCMTVLALRLSRRANAVSALHGEVSRAMWTGLFRGKPEDEVPIGHITNGVHVPSWLAPQMFRLYDRHLGTDWQQRGSEAKTWLGIENVDDGELWETHLNLKSQLIEFVSGTCRRSGRTSRRIAGGFAAPGSRAEPGRSDNRLRPTVCDVQESQPYPDRHRAARFHGE